MRKMPVLMTVLCMAMSLAVPANAVEYTIEAPEGANFGKPTSIEVVVTADGGAAKNEDVSKNAAMIPPMFGSNTSNLLWSGTYLTPDLAPGAMAETGVMVSGNNAAVLLPGSTIQLPFVGSSVTATGYTEVTDDLYYSAGHLGTLKIPAIDLSVKIYEGTNSTALKKGAGHFEDTSIWDGNVALAAHNRGVNDHFGKIHTLELGDKITLTTKLGTRTYAVTNVFKVDELDRSGLTASADNMLTLYTCVRNVRDQRWCVQAMEIV